MDLGWILNFGVDLESWVPAGGWILNLGCQWEGGSWVDLGTCVGPGGGSWVDLETWVTIGGWILGGP